MQNSGVRRGRAWLLGASFPFSCLYTTFYFKSVSLVCCKGKVTCIFDCKVPLANFHVQTNLFSFFSRSEFVWEFGCNTGLVLFFLLLLCCLYLCGECWLCSCCGLLCNCGMSKMISAARKLGWAEVCRSVVVYWMVLSPAMNLGRTSNSVVALLMPGKPFLYMCIRAVVSCAVLIATLILKLYLARFHLINWIYFVVGRA